MTTASPPPRVVVIGGGITGLTAAYRLRRLARCTNPGDPPRYPPAVYRDIVLDFSHAHDLHREGDAATRAP